VLAIVADAKAKPLKQTTAALIEGYLEVKAYADQAPARLRSLIDKRKGRFAAAIDAFERRGALIEESGVRLSEVPFSGEFGRNVAYYSGFVFEVLALSLGAASPVAGGGRYDGLLRTVGAPRDVPAVGGAIHTERLLAVVGGKA
jgi:ATP phosphoribosyltransferase regulatory subunit